jgi:RNA polymerase sigma factor (sigma-70 family)
MDEADLLAGRFEASRPRLRSVAYRMLGSLAEADDALQEAWLHLARSGTEGVQNLEGWLTTIVARVCLDMLRTRRSRREEPLDAEGPLAPASGPVGTDDPPGPENEAVLADSVGLAMLVVLDKLAPAERVAFVLHDMFDMPFAQIAEITGRTPAAARQLASRARRRVSGRPAAARASATQARHHEVVAAWLAAARAGDFEALLAILDPDVAIQTDRPGVPAGTPVRYQGAAFVAGQAVTASGIAQVSSLALVNGKTAIVAAPRGRLQVVLMFTVNTVGKITALDVITDPERLQRLDIAVSSLAQ